MIWYTRNNYTSETVCMYQYLKWKLPRVCTVDIIFPPKVTLNYYMVRCTDDVITLLPHYITQKSPYSGMIENRIIYGLAVNIIKKVM